MAATSSHADRSLIQSVCSGDLVPEVIHAEARIRRAQLDADVAELDRLIGDPLLFAGPDGNLATKAEDLELHRSGRVRFREHRPLDLRLRAVSPDVVVTSLEAFIAADVDGQHVSGTYRYVRVWWHGPSGDWQVVGGQVSRINGR